MLKPAENRQNYGDLLIPPDGYSVDIAIGTTYSLDLEALVGIPLSLSLSEEMGQSQFANPMYLLEAIRKSSDKFILFCQGGQIKSPQNSNTLFSLFENNIFEVTLPENYSFHPKMWIIKYSNQQKDSIYRLIVMSRNLTFDRSWDLVFSVEGKKGTSKKKNSQPLIDFLNFLLPFAQEDKKTKSVKKLIDELSYVDFSGNDKSFPSINMLPIGIPGYGKESTGLFQTWQDVILFSPFLSKRTVEEFLELAASDGRKILFTRRSELTKLTQEIIDEYEVYVLKDFVVEGEFSFSESDSSDEHNEAMYQDIHAKMYVCKRGNQYHFFIGSANCSYYAFHGNTEFMLHFQYKKYGFRLEHVLQDLFGEEETENPFERITALPHMENQDTNMQDVLEQAIKQVSRLKAEAFVTSHDEGYQIRLQLESVPDQVSMQISPLLGKKFQPLQTETFIGPLSLLELGEFYRIKASIGDEKLERVLKIPTAGIPKERISEVFQSIIKDKQGFLAYITFLLAEDYLQVSIEQQLTQSAGTMGSEGGLQQEPILYEHMLHTFAATPERLQEVKEVIGLIEDKAVIPEEFEVLYRTFLDAMKKVRK